MLWSYILACWTTTGLLLVGKGHRWGWLVALSGQVPWIFYSFATRQYGFLISVVLHGYAYTYDYIKEGQS